MPMRQALKRTKRFSSGINDNGAQRRRCRLCVRIFQCSSIKPIQSDQADLHVHIATGGVRIRADITVRNVDQLLCDGAVDTR